jgi:hypothetical protein
MPIEDQDDADEPVVVQQQAAPRARTAAEAAKAKAGKSKAPKQTKQEALDADPGYQAYVALSGGTIRKADGKFAAPGEKLFGAEAPATEREAAAAQPERQEEPAAETPPKAEPKVEGASTAEREKFLGLARRFKIPTKVAEAAMFGDREALIAWTTELDTMQARFDELSGRSAETKGAPKGTTQEPKAGTPKAATKGAPAGSEPGSDIREQLVEALAQEGLSEGFADTLLAIVKPGQSAQNGPTMEALAEQLRSLHEAQARSALSKEFRGLTDEASFASVRDRVARWIASGVYEPNQVVEAMRDSCKIEFHGKRAGKEEAEDDEPDARDEGSPTQPRRGTKTTVSSGDPDYDAYVSLTRGANPKDVRSRYTR